MINPYESPGPSEGDCKIFECITQGLAWLFVFVSFGNMLFVLVIVAGHDIRLSPDSPYWLQEMKIALDLLYKHAGKVMIGQFVLQSIILILLHTIPGRNHESLPIP